MKKLLDQIKLIEKQIKFFEEALKNKRDQGCGLTLAVNFGGVSDNKDYDITGVELSGDVEHIYQGILASLYDSLKLNKIFVPAELEGKQKAYKKLMHEINKTQKEIYELDTFLKDNK